MKKGILGILFTAVIIVAIALVVAYSYAHVILGKALEKAIGTEVKVGRVVLGLSGAGLYGVQIMNPEGFSEKKLAEINKLEVNYELGSLFRKKVHVTSLNIDLGDFTVERAGTTKVNLLELDAVKGGKDESGKDSSSTPSTPEEPSMPSTSSEPMDVQVDKATFSLGKVRYVDSSVTPTKVRELDLNIQDRTLKNVTDPKDVTQQIVKIIMSEVGVEVLKSKVSEQAGELKEKAGEAISGFLSKLKGEG